MFKSNNKISFSLLSEERSSLMGFSIIWIMFFHSYLELGNYRLLGIIHDFGNMGVEIFLIVSGIGLYYSVNNIRGTGNKSWVGSFYKKRVLRIIPTTVICLLPWFLYLYRHELPINPIRFIMDITSLSFWIDGQNRGWYIALILVLYLIYPLIYYKISDNFHSNMIWLFVFIAFDIVLNTIICLFFPDWFEAVNLALCRVPVFLVGCFISPLVMEKKGFPKFFITVMLFVVVALAILLNKTGEQLHFFGIYRYLYALMALMISLVFVRISSINHELLLFRFFRFVGKYTLELYLTHTQVLTVLNDTFLPICNSAFLINLLAIIISLFLSIIIHKTINWFFTRIRKT